MKRQALFFGCLVDLGFNGPINTTKVISSRSVYLISKPLTFFPQKLKKKTQKKNIKMSSAAVEILRFKV